MCSLRHRGVKRCANINFNLQAQYYVEVRCAAVCRRDRWEAQQ